MCLGGGVALQSDYAGRWDLAFKANLLLPAFPKSHNYHSTFFPSRFITSVFI